jgi:hypothetical protein
MADKNPGEGKYYTRDPKGKPVREDIIGAALYNAEARQKGDKTSPTELAKNMEKSDAKRAALKKVLVAKKAAKDKNKGDVIPQGPRSKSNPFVDVNDPKGNVARYGRKFTAPKGKTGTSYTIPSKKKGMK